ncbi:MAG: Toxin-antitoxin system, toxin component, RelE family [Daejeonella sp.]|nr:Toxin-antitoxin system, toxin component, RelE family [Daejeonella sp.]
MNFNIKTSSEFEKGLKYLSKKYPSIRNDYAALLDELEANPKSGDAIGKNCYKVRMAIRSKNKGKSGGARVITHLLAKLEGETLYLLKIYDKNNLETISDKELEELLKDI